jgi:aminoglycoside phosphotransferase (APT) family kinase protein
MVESATKYPLTPAELKHLVRRAFGQTKLAAVEEFTGGYFASAYRIEFEDGPDPVVLKLGAPPEAEVLSYEANLMRAEILALRLVGCDARIPAPRIVLADRSRRLVPVDYCFMELLPGISWNELHDSLTDEQNAAIERQVGTIAAAIAEFTRPTFGYFRTAPAFEAWPDALRFMCAQLYADAGRFGIVPSLPQAELLGYLDRYHAALTEVQQPRLVHWDLWGGNVLVTMDEWGGDDEHHEGGDAVPTVTGIIDFERALWGDPLMEFIPARLGGIEAFEAGFGAPLLDTPAKRLRRLLYNVYLGLVLVVEDGPRRYTDKSSVIWGRGLLDEARSMLARGG